VTTIIGYVNLLLSEATGSVDEPQRKYLQRIKSSAEQVLRTIRAMGGSHTHPSGPIEGDEDEAAVRQHSAEMSTSSD
jgi:hypothetical protein